VSAATAVCPACGARFRGAVLCSRCGADLTRLMSLAAFAHLQRAGARRLLLEGDFAGALAQAREAQVLAATPEGEAIARIAACLVAAAGGPRQAPG
jgi:hypothetical protein